MKAANTELPLWKYITYELHKVICFQTTKGKMTAETHRESGQAYGENCIDVLHVRRWKREFENNCYVLLEDRQRSGWLADSLITDNIYGVCKILEADDCFTLNEIVAHMPPVRCGWLTTQSFTMSCRYKNSPVAQYHAFWLTTTWQGTWVCTYNF